MGEIMDSLGCNCNKMNKAEEAENNIIETEESNPKSLIDIKINTTKFVTKRAGRCSVLYDRLDKLGNGAFGSVFKVKRKGLDNINLIRAMKVIEKDQIIVNGEDEVKNEINVLKQLDHPNIMKIYEFFEDENNLYIICEFCDSGDLAEKMDKYGVFPEFLVKYVMYQVFMGVAFLHANKVFHGDIKRENVAFVSITDDKEVKIFEKLIQNPDLNEELMGASGHINLSKEALEYCKELSNYELKILDFGSARKKKKEDRNKKLSGIVGTTYYCSPEIVKDKYDYESDEWACGVMMYILLSGIPPFNGNTEEEVFDKVMNSVPNLNIKQLQNVSKPCKNLIKGLLEKDPSKRIKASDALDSEFFRTGINIGNLIKGVWRDNAKVLTKFLTVRTKSFKKTSKFKEAVIAYIAMNFTDKNQEKVVKQIFRDLSEDNKKFLITKKTFVTHMRKVCKDFSEKELGDLFDNMDENSSGNLEYEELMRALSDKEKLLSEKNLRQAFDFFDKDRSGKITFNEITDVVFPSGDVSKNIIKEFLEEIDQKDQNMAITFEDFKKIIKDKEGEE